MTTMRRRTPSPQQSPQPTPLAIQVIKEAMRYQTVDMVASWALVANAFRDVLDYYESVKKRSDPMRMLLSFGEAMLGVYCRLLLLPIARSPFARTPLKIGDHFAIKGARLLEITVPRIKDKTEPLCLDGELLVTLAFLPLSLCLAMAHATLQWAEDQYVSVFPRLKETAGDFKIKSLIGQWVTLLLMSYVYLPLQFISHPSETIQQALTIPSRVTWAVVSWNIGNLMAVLHNVSEWFEWSRDTAAYCLYTWLGLVIAALEYWYFLFFTVTGLERSLISVVRKFRDYIGKGDGAIATTLSSLGQTPIARWLGDVLANSEIGLVKTLKGLWYGQDEREELKRHRRPGGRHVHLASPDEGPRPLPLSETKDLNPSRVEADVPGET